ncbi:MAG: SGNH/GDSL hydrolase family protein [Clostridia bacterium]|nr:SGNH/GDSL hydrolase family protein [Clostridia bacterium]
MNEIYLFGDSTAQGIVLDEKGQYRISRQGCIRLLKRKGFPILNYAVHGYTVRQGIASFEKTPAEPGAVCVIQFGGNDCDLDWDAVASSPEVFHDGRVPLDAFQKELTRFVRAARKSRMEPVLVTPLALMSGRYYRWVSRERNAESILHYLREDPESISRWQEGYANAVREVSAGEKCRLLDLRDWMLKRLDYPMLICDDGIHPNEAGHAVIAEMIDAHCARN